MDPGASLPDASLPDAFLDWWFAPWDAAAQPSPHAAMTGTLALRDGYHAWCAHAQLAPQLPPGFDPAWAKASGTDGSALGPTARLYGGLLAARAQDAAALATLSAAERDWCLRLAATQPLHSLGGDVYLPSDGLGLRGLCELACHLRTAFPGLWPRLRGGIDAASGARIDTLLAAMPHALDAVAATRARRCWLRCRARAMQGA